MEESRHSLRWMRRFALSAAIQCTSIVSHAPAIFAAENGMCVRLPSVASRPQSEAKPQPLRLPKPTSEPQLASTPARVSFEHKDLSPSLMEDWTPTRLPRVAPRTVSYRAPSKTTESMSVSETSKAASKTTQSGYQPTSISSTIHESKLRDLAEQSLRDAYGSLRREATYSAQKMTTESLRLLVAISDSRAGGTQHAAELESALLAIQESADFWGPQGPIDHGTLERSIAVHETEILHNVALDDVSNLQATALYLDYARSQLVLAAGSVHEVGDALVLLGMIEKRIARDQSPHAASVALTMQRAAVEINPASGYCHRELGKTLLSQGLASEAVAELRQSVAIQATRGGLEALQFAAVRANDLNLASQCAAELNNPQLPSDGPVYQLPPDQFAMTYRPDASNLNRSLNSGSKANHTEAPPVAEKRSWFPFSRR